MLALLSQTGHLHTAQILSTPSDMTIIVAWADGRDAKKESVHYVTNVSTAFVDRPSRHKLQMVSL